jgi:hypothetical protein
VLHVRGSAHLRLQPPSLLLLVAVVGVAPGCGRSELDGLDDLSSSDAGGVALEDGNPAVPNADVVGPHDANGSSDATPPADPCKDAPPIPCAGGGFKYCVAGRYSDCPRRCVACVPGSQRVCLMAYCNYWGTQTCTADGQSFGYCVEHTAPPECEAIAEEHHDSSELEQCCLDHGYCCKDQFDLNHNGNTNEQIGQCSAVTCS